MGVDGESFLAEGGAGRALRPQPPAALLVAQHRELFFPLLSDLVVSAPATVPKRVPPVPSAPRRCPSVPCGIRKVSCVFEYECNCVFSTSTARHSDLHEELSRHLALSLFSTRSCPSSRSRALSSLQHPELSHKPLSRCPLFSTRSCPVSRTLLSPYFSPGCASQARSRALTSSLPPAFCPRFSARSFPQDAPARSLSLLQPQELSLSGLRLSPRASSQDPLPQLAAGLSLKGCQLVFLRAPLPLFSSAPSSFTLSALSCAISAPGAVPEAMHPASCNPPCSQGAACPAPAPGTV